MVHLPDGPTAHFRVSNCWKRKEIPNHGNPTGYNPELILQGFDTRLGQRIARMFMALFPQRPEFRGRCVVTLKNQRDFLFFRHHRYLFKDEGRKVILQEVGPRMTLKLRRLEQGTFQGKHAKQEFLYQPNMQVSRKKFFL
jgi:ribosome production factor 1